MTDTIQSDSPEYVAVPFKEYLALYTASRALCEYGPNETLRENLRSAGIKLERALDVMPDMDVVVR